MIGSVRLLLPMDVCVSCSSLRDRQGPSEPSVRPFLTIRAACIILARRLNTDETNYNSNNKRILQRFVCSTFNRLV